MARLEANLTTFTMASDYDPTHYNWTEKELAALGNCKATAKVIKRRLEDNSMKVKEMNTKARKRPIQRQRNTTIAPIPPNRIIISL